MKVRVVGDHVTKWLNGVEMIDLADERIGAAEGVIVLQIHDGGDNGALAEFLRGDRVMVANSTDPFSGRAS